jgi:hypothetical protein
MSEPKDPAENGARRGFLKNVDVVGVASVAAGAVAIVRE